MGARRRPAFLSRTAISGVGYTELSRASGRSVLSLAAEACRNALEDAGLEREAVDGIASFSLLNDSVPGQAVATVLGLPKLDYALDLNLGGQAPSFMVMNAALAVASGLAENVLVYRALNGRSGVRVGSSRFAGPGAQYRYPIGFTAYPQYIAMWARRYLIETGAGYEDLGAVAVAQRRYAELNERAVVRKPLTLEEYLEAPFVADPFRVPDCTSEVDGACALLVTSVERARRLRHPPAVIEGAAYALGHRAGLDIGDALLCEGYLHGMNTVAEAVLQIQGRGGERQVPRHDACVVTSGGMMDGSALVLTRG